MSKLLAIVEGIGYKADRTPPVMSDGDSAEAIKQLMLEIVGEDEQRTRPSAELSDLSAQTLNIRSIGRNDLRKELRRIINAL